MAVTVRMLAPAGFGGTIQAVGDRMSGNIYAPDASGLVNAAPSDVPLLLKLGFLFAPENCLGALIGANMNVTTDQAFTMFAGQAPFRVTKITARNASTSLTTAVGGLYTAAAKGGTAVVANTQVFSALTGATLAVDLTIASTPGNTVWAASQGLFLSLTTAQGAAATADLWLFGDQYPA